MPGGIDAREGQPPTSTSEGRERFARRNINILRDKLPAPDDGEWTATEIGMNPWELQEWVEAGIIERTRTHPDEGCDAQLYATTEPGWEALAGAPESRGGLRLPCGHYGLRNPRGREGLACVYDACEMVFEREEIEGAGC